MMKIKSISVFLISALLLTFLFHKQSLGLNLFIAEMLFFCYALFTKQFVLKGLYAWICSLGYLLTSVFTIISYSTMGYWVNFLCVMIFIGLMIYPQVNSLISAWLISAFSFINVPSELMSRLKSYKFFSLKLGSVFTSLRIYLVPLVIIILFLFLYSASSTFFQNILETVFNSLTPVIEFIAKHLNVSLIFTFLISLYVSSYLLFRTTNKAIENKDSDVQDVLHRTRRRSYVSFKVNDLKYEYKSGLFLLIILNALLFVLNVSDIYNVWFNFSWSGEYLKEFVHEGTYFLIASIILSVIIALHLFRRNLNFYSANNKLKQICMIWIAQNMILAVSVAVRNMHYIHYYSLAYKRIGVFIFLVLAIYGLYTILIKIRDKKTVHFLLRKNTLAFYVVVVISSLINWDVVIAKYNFAHAGKSFVHFNFLSRLENKALPYLDFPLDYLNEIDSLQKEKFSQEEFYLTSEEYHNIISSRKKTFIKEWEAKHWLSWNLPEYKAYRKLKN